MRLNCELEVVYSLAVMNGGGRSASKTTRSKASVCLGKKPVQGPAGGDKRSELYLIVSTVKNVSGSKYKVKNNVTKIFAKFVHEGKATIKFKEPAHDLFISKAEPDKLKELLKVLRLTPQEQTGVELAPLLPTKMQHIEAPKTKLVVKSRGEYPIKGFPSSLERFEAVGVSLNRLDMRLLELKMLQFLDLSNNSIKSLPEGLKDACLIELKLTGNKLTEFPDSICIGNLSERLKLLDLARNSLAHLSHKFSNFKSLVQLRLDCNQLQVLPRTFGKMTTLKFLSISNNKLVVLPPSFPSLSLESLDLFGNPFTASGLVRRCSDLSLPTLQELTGRVIKKSRIPYSPYVLPIGLCHYLDSAKKCLCGKACFNSFLHYIANLNLHKVSATVTAVDQSGTTKVPVEAFLCSAKCLKLWNL